MCAPVSLFHMPAVRKPLPPQGLRPRVATSHSALRAARLFPHVLRLSQTPEAYPPGHRTFVRACIRLTPTSLGLLPDVGNIVALTSLLLTRCSLPFALHASRIERRQRRQSKSAEGRTAHLNPPRCRCMNRQVCWTGLGELTRPKNTTSPNHLATT